MPVLIEPGTRLADIHTVRRAFMRLRIGQIFCWRGRWYSKRTSRTAVYADCTATTPTYFKGPKNVNVLVESNPGAPKGVTFEQFVNDSSL